MSELITAITFQLVSWAITLTLIGAVAILAIPAPAAGV